jgi:LmbE family N-acetylglucosaminyl deacetylase
MKTFGAFYTGSDRRSRRVKMKSTKSLQGFNLFMSRLKTFTRSFLRFTAIFLLVIAHLDLLSSSRAQATREFNETGAVALGQLLRRLQTTASVLHTGAHPDDEDTALIARLARGDGARVAYLSLTRGEGGQNRIGAELYDALGVIRTEELLQARSIDGGEQFFTRAFDYGFSKTRTEAAAKWNEREILGDMVRAIRMFRPTVIVSRFAGTEADGHGHHQFAGYLTPLAVRAAADPTEFPEQIAEGLRAWQVRKLYVGENFRSASNNVPNFRLNTGRYDPLFGRSYFELAMQSRSLHRSQEMGALELRGAQTSGLRLAQNFTRTSASPLEGENIFAGIDTSISGIAREFDLRDENVRRELSNTESAARQALINFNALASQRIVPALIEGLRSCTRARALLAQNRTDNAQIRADADFLLARKEDEFTEAIRIALGVRFDVLADTETIVPGESFIVAARIFHTEIESAPDREALSLSIEAIRMRAPQGWRVEQIVEPSPRNENALRRREIAQSAQWFRVTLPSNAALTEPYWLREPRRGDVFRWPTTERAASHLLPFAASEVSGEAALRITGGAENVSLNIAQPLQYRFADAVRGEVRRHVAVVPALSVRLDTDLIIVPVPEDSSAPQPTTRRIAVRVVNNSSNRVSGQIRLRGVSAAWRVRAAQNSFSFQTRGDRATVFFDLDIPANALPRADEIIAEAVTSDGRRFDREMISIAYPHINTHRIYRPARVTVRVMPLRIAPVRVGYIMGSGDLVPEAIRRIGIEPVMLDEAMLSGGDLNADFDVIIVGVRASETRLDFVANNSRLLDFVRRGGTLIVQYQQRDYLERNLAPFPAEMAARVTDENAPIRTLQPAHPRFNFPNRITEEDWSGWVHERSLYNFTTFDPRYVPLIESHDAGEPENRGSELYAEIGRGRYVYTSLAWFRQLPAGVPGAYRLFANLLSLPRAERQERDD